MKGEFRLNLYRILAEEARRRRRRRKDGGSEPVSVEPNRPKLGEGGAAAPLEFDDRP